MFENGGRMDGQRTTNGQRTDDGPWLYYKLTNEPKGSGELKRLVCFSLFVIQKEERLLFIIC